MLWTSKDVIPLPTWYAVVRLAVISHTYSYSPAANIFLHTFIFEDLVTRRVHAADGRVKSWFVVYVCLSSTSTHSDSSFIDRAMAIYSSLRCVSCVYSSDDGPYIRHWGVIFAAGRYPAKHWQKFSVNAPSNTITYRPICSRLHTVRLVLGVLGGWTLLFRHQ